MARFDERDASIGDDLARSCDDYAADVAAIQEGIDDMIAGRVQPLEVVDAEIRQQFGFKRRQ